MGKVLKVVGLAAFGALFLPVAPFLAVGITSAWTMWAVGTAAIVGLQMASRALGPKMARGAGEMSAPVRSSIPSRVYIYGRARVAGTLVFAQGHGSDNDFMSMVWAVASHEVDAYEKFYLDTDEITLSGNNAVGDLAGYLNVYWQYGTAGQAANAVLTAAVPSKWTSDHKLSGTAYYIVRYKYKDKKWPNGLRQSYVLVRGKKLYDPRKDSTVPGGVGSHRHADPASWEWSDNPALVWLDYLTDDFIGCQIPVALVDLASVMAAANICDEDVPLKGGGTQKRYVLNAVIDSAAGRDDNISQILTAMSGRHIEQGGRFYVYAAGWVTPTITLDEDDLAGVPQVTWKTARRERFNAVKGIFLDDKNHYQAGEIPLRVNPTWETQDGGDRIWRDVSLPVTVDHRRAQRLALLTAKAARKEITVTWPCNLKGLLLKANDTVYLNYARYGWALKSFRVLEWSLTAEGVVNLLLKEEDASVYSWTAATDELDKPSSTGVTTYDPATAYAPTTFAALPISVTGTGGTVTPGVRLTWDAVTSPFIKELEIQWKQNAATAWTPVNGEDPTVGAQIVAGLMPGVVHNFRARFISTTGVVGDWVSVNATTLTDLIAGEASSVTWGNVSGAGKPQDGATVGATIGVNITGDFGGANILPNSSFEAGGVAFSDLYNEPDGGSVSFEFLSNPGDAVHGSRSIRMTVNGSHGFRVHYFVAYKSTVSFSFWVRNSGVYGWEPPGGHVPGNFAVGVWLFNSTTASVVGPILAVDEGSLGAMWERRSGTITGLTVGQIYCLRITTYPYGAGTQKVDTDAWQLEYGDAPTAYAPRADEAVWSGVYGTGTPENSATNNTIYRQSTDPGAVANGSLWYNTTTRVYYVRTGGAWQVTATYNTGALADKNQTDTADITNGAVTNIASVEEASTISSGVVATWTDVTSVTMNVQGGTLFAMFDCVMHHASSVGTVSFRLLEDGVVKKLVSPTSFGSGLSGFMHGLLTASFTAKSGNGVVYKIQSNTGSASNADLAGATLFVIQTKR